MGFHRPSTYNEALPDSIHTGVRLYCIFTVTLFRHTGLPFGV